MRVGVQRSGSRTGAARPVTAADHAQLEYGQAPEAAPDDVSAAGRLQSLAGNRAVAQLLARQPPGHGTVTAKPADQGLARLEQVWSRLVEFETRATPQLQQVGARIDGYLERYDAAYGEVDKLLTEAHERHEEAHKWDWALNILIGTALGFTGGLVLESAEMVGQLVGELIIKSGEEGMGYALEGTSPDFQLPAEVSNDRVGRHFEHELRKGWEAVGVIGGAGWRFSRRRDALRDARSPGHPVTLTDKDLSILERVGDGLSRAEVAFGRFVAAADTPVLERSQTAIERDLWVAWMSESVENAVTATGGGDGPIGSRVREIGVTSDISDPSGWLAASPDLAAKKEMARLAQLGRVGVVVVPPYDRPSDPPLQGAVHVRPDAYLATGRVQPPATAGAPEYIAITVVRGQYLRSGEVVILADTAPGRYGLMSDADEGGGLVPRRLNAVLPVSHSEREAGAALFGRGLNWYPRTEPEVVTEGTDWGSSPERARMLVYPIFEIVHNMRDVTPALVVRDSEDGVLVSEADGTALVLFTAYVSYQDAKAAGVRTGAHRVVTIDFNPQSMLEDIDEGAVMMTRNQGAGFLEAEIRAVRALLGRAPVYGPAESQAGARHRDGP